MEVRTTEHGVRLKVGVDVLDPMNRTCTITELIPTEMEHHRLCSSRSSSPEDDPRCDCPADPDHPDHPTTVKIRMRGPYAGTVNYPASALRPAP